MLQWLGWGAGMVGVVAMVVSAVKVGENRAKDETIVAQQATIGALETRVSTVEAQQQQEARNCEQQMAELRGKVELLSSQQAEVIAGAMAPQVTRGLVQALASGEWGVR